jgi:3-oxoadipate enol-lactonase
MDEAGTAEQQVVFLHGMGTGPDSWDDQVAGLADGFVGHAPRIAGLSDGGGEFSVGRAVDEVVAGLDRHGIDRAHVCGLSLGAMLATQLTITHPERVASLVLSGGQVHPPRALMALQAGLTRVLPRRVIAPDGTSRRRILAVQRALARVDFRGRLGDITVPTLVLCGSRDVANLPAARALAAGIPGARLQVIDGAGHEINTERPEAFSAALAEFLPAA